MLLALISTLLIPTNAFSGDAFGLGAHKKSVEQITGSDKSYRTKFGNPISVYTIEPKAVSKNEAPVRFLVQGGIHGNELLASEFVGWLAQRFESGESPITKLNGGRVAVDFLPYANPDGTILYTRLNSNRINLNRNFDVLWGNTKENPGKAPFSEVESQAIRDLMLTRSYAGAVDVHGYVNWIVAPTSPKDSISGLDLRNKARVATYDKWYRAITTEVKAQLPGYEVKTAGGLGDGGAFEDFAFWTAGVPAFCLEVFSQNRFVATTLASKFIDLITPRVFTSKAMSDGHSDMFLVYESFIHSMFQNALDLNKDNSLKPVVAER